MHVRTSLMILTVTLALGACGGGAASATTEETTNEPTSGGAQSESSPDAPAAADAPAAEGPAVESTVAAVAGGEVTSGRVRVHGHAVQLQESADGVAEIEVGAEATSDEQPKVYCRPGELAPIASGSVEWMAEVTVEGTVQPSAGGRVLLADCVLVP